MAFDGNGNWISDFSAVADRDADIKILASRFDNIFIADIATSFENCLTKDGQVKTHTNFNLNNYRAINVADPVSDKDAVNKQSLESRVVTLLSDLYPVGSLYIGTQTTCPLETLISGSTWELVAQDKALWTGDGTNANTTINAGLPNITGSLYGVRSGGVSGAFGSVSTSKDIDAGTTYFSNTLNFNASRSSSIYGASDTVQPPAYVVNVWRRTA